MEAVLIGVGLPLLSAVLAGFSNIISKEVLLDDVPVPAFVTLSFIAIAIWMTPIAAIFFQMRNLTIAIPLITGIILIDTAANYLFFSGMNVQEVSRNEAIIGFSPLFTALLAGIFLPSHITLHAVVAVTGITASLYLLNHEKDDNFFHQVILKKNYLPLLGALLFGFSAILTRYALKEYAVTNPETLYWIRAIVISLIFWGLFRPNVRDISLRLHGIIGGRALIVIGQWMAFLYALKLSNIVVTTALVRASPLFTLFFAVLVLDDEMTWKKLAAILLTLISVTFIALHTTLI